MIKEFRTDSGVLVRALTTEQMREVDRIATEETGPNLYQMIENAGRNLATMTLEILGPGWNNSVVVVLSGPGGNGDGGLCAARHLANRGLDVRVCLAKPERLGGVPGFQRKVFRATGGREVRLSELEASASRPHIILDALVGYSLRGAPQGTVADLIKWTNRSQVPTLFLDLPSGVDATSGERAGEFVRPKWTLTLALPKTGCCLRGAASCGWPAPPTDRAMMGLPSRPMANWGKSGTAPMRDWRIWRKWPNA